MADGREMNFNVHSVKQDFLSSDHKMTHDLDMNFNVQFGKQDMTDDRVMNVYSCGQEPTLDRLRS